MKPVKQPGKTILSMKITDLAKVADSVSAEDLRDCRKEVPESLWGFEIEDKFWKYIENQIDLGIQFYIMRVRRDLNP